MQKDIQDLPSALASLSEQPPVLPKAAPPTARGITLAAEAAQAAQRELMRAVDNVWRLQKSLESAMETDKEAGANDVKPRHESLC